MSKKVKDSLHELIHALSKSEKRYYKVFASRHMSSEDSTMIALFDFIVRQETYDEEQLFTHFMGKAFLNQFSTIKRRLYEHILQSLDSFHSNSSTEVQISRMIHQAQLLYQKSLYDQCLRHLRSAGKLAARHEFNLLLLQIQKLRRKCAQATGNGPEQEQSCVQTTELLGSETLLSHLHRLKVKIFQLMQQSGTATHSLQDEQLDSLIAQLPEVKDPTIAQSAEAVFLVHHISAAYHFARGRLASSLEHTENTIGHLHLNPQLDEQPVLLLSALTNACYLAESLGLTDKATRHLERLKELHKMTNGDTSETNRIRFFTTISSIELSVLILKGRFREAATQIGEISQQLHELESLISPARSAFLHLKLSIAAFGSQRFSEALKHLNIILNDTRLQGIDDVVTTVRLMNICTHFELGHTDHLPYAIKQARKTSECDNLPWLTIFLNGMQQLTRVHPLDHRDVFAKVLRQLSELKSTETLKQHFDFLSWIASKAHGQNFETAVREQYHFSTLQRK